MSTVETSQRPLSVTVADERYHRQELISWWDQERLRSARIAVVGAGALGNEICKNLALLGEGHLDVIDMDDVEYSNLARCVLFRDADQGPTRCRRRAAITRRSTVAGVRPGQRRGALGRSSSAASPPAW